MKNKYGDDWMISVRMRKYRCTYLKQGTFNDPDTEYCGYGLNLPLMKCTFDNCPFKVED